MTNNAGENVFAGASTPVIYNQTLAIANYEYSQQLPRNTRKFQVKPRQNDREIKLAFNPGESGTVYVTVPPGGYWHDAVGMPYQVIYFQTETEGTIIEIEAWN
jgi:hypothetical protein